jgi:NAD(P)-dependent dehydrogenase (short-subunit alcohol dehydrogenase family)|tara:strand:+ start:892 stop:1722 length:831 start_codon:yes stop_codon:yes gene_type:complete
LLLEKIYWLGSYLTPRFYFQQDITMNKRIAVITGGNRGLGKSTVLCLAKQSIDCIFTYRSHEKEAKEVVKQVQDLGSKAVALQLDVSDMLGFEDFAQQLQNVLQTHWQQSEFDYLINNAGVGLTSSFADTSESTFDTLVNINLRGVFFVTQTLLPFIKNGGRIINLSSGLTRFSLPGHITYAMTKGAIEVMTRYLAQELAPKNIAVNVVAPGAIETDFGNGVVRDNDEVNAFITSQTAMGRVGVTDDIGPMIANLLADENRWMTGQRLEVSGGMYM